MAKIVFGSKNKMHLFFSHRPHNNKNYRIKKKNIDTFKDVDATFDNTIHGMEVVPVNISWDFLLTFICNVDVYDKYNGQQLIEYVIKVG